MMNKSKILAFIVLSALVLSLFSGSMLMKAKAVDLTSAISLTVKIPQDFSEKDLDKVTVDLYKIAKADPVDGYDTYKLTLLEDYASLKLDQVNEAGSTDWKKIQEDAANIALKKEDPKDPDVTGMKLGEKKDLTEVGPGLFLVVAHGTGEYIKYPEKEGEIIETLVDGEKCVYHFNPQLISIPDRFDPETGASNTANNDIPWEYDVELNLKGKPVPKLGDLEIIKTLIARGDAQIRPCTVVFTVIGTYKGEIPYEKEDGTIYKKGDTVYEKTHAINFNGDMNPSSIEIKGLPCDTEVLIREDYPGAGYACTSPEGGAVTVTIIPEDKVQAEFENTLNNSTFGVGIINHFEYVDGDWSVSNPDVD